MELAESAEAAAGGCWWAAAASVCWRGDTLPLVTGSRRGAAVPEGPASDCEGCCGEAALSGRDWLACAALLAASRVPGGDAGDVWAAAGGGCVPCSASLRRCGRTAPFRGLAAPRFCGVERCTLPPAAPPPVGGEGPSAPTTHPALSSCTKTKGGMHISPA